MVNRNPVGVTLLTKDALEMKRGHSYGVQNLASRRWYRQVTPTEDHTLRSKSLRRRALEFGPFEEEQYPISMCNPRNSQVGKGGLPRCTSLDSNWLESGGKPPFPT